MSDVPKNWANMRYSQRIWWFKKQWNLSAASDLTRLVAARCRRMRPEMFDHQYCWKRREVNSAVIPTYTQVICCHPYSMPWPSDEAILFARTYSATVRHLPAWSLHPICPMLMFEWTEWDAMIFLG